MGMQEVDFRADCATIILAGGHSTRFGREKANAVWRGVRLVDHVAAAARIVCAEIVAVARPEQSMGDWSVDRVVADDGTLPEGPLRGIVSGLEGISRPWAFVVTCDAPLVQPSFIRALRAWADDDVDVVVPEWEGHLQPLVAVYSRRCAAAFRLLAEAGERSPRRALGTVACRVIGESACREIDPRGLSFRNVNRVEDLAALDFPDRTDRAGRNA